MVDLKRAQLLFTIVGALVLPHSSFATPLLWSCEASESGINWECNETVPTSRYSSDISTAITQNDIYDLTLPEIATELGWVNNDKTSCHGYYQKAPIRLNTADGLGSDSVSISADRTLFSEKDTTTLIGNVSITQPGRLISTDRAYVYRDKNSSSPSKIKLEGNITLRQPQSYILAGLGSINFPSKAWSLESILYQQSLQQHETDAETEQHIYGVSAWGRAKSAEQNAPKIVDFYDATYTTCPPNKSSAWSLYGKHIHMDHNTGRGYITNSLFYIKDVPVFYWPYFNFPIDDRRQTGFLAPSYGHSTRSGDEFTIPFYWNIAPNYDATFTPNFMDQRGVNLTTQARYKQKWHSGVLNLSILPSDRKFKDFKDTEPNEFTPATTTPAQASALDDLSKASTNRSAISWQENVLFSRHLTGHINYNWVSDDYYLIDLSQNVISQTDTQLPQNANLTYQDNNVQIIGNIQHYQTLHPLTEATVKNQYTRLPQIKLATQLPQHPYSLQFDLNSEYNYFTITRNPGATIAQPKGSRLNLQPQVSLPLARPGMFITPRVQFVLTTYKLHDAGTNVAGQNNQTDPTRALPIIDVNAGLEFERETRLFGNHYTQTFEPQAYYVYVPYENQNNLPLFDSYDTTQPLAFTYDQMFRYNRFTSVDRIGDTNQVTLSLSTRFLEQDSSVERFRASIGQIFYFQNRKVALCSNNPADSGIYADCNDLSESTVNANQQSVSPIAGIISYQLYNHWSLLGSMAWNPDTRRTDNQSINLNYNDTNNRSFNLGYTFAREGDILDTMGGTTIDSNHNDLEQSTVSISWPVTERIKMLGQWGYNLSHHHIQNYIYGVEYEDCCWAVRFVGTRTFTGLDQNLNKQYDKAVYLQFALKGLSRLGFNDPSGTIATNIKGYHDNFGHY